MTGRKSLLRHTRNMAALLGLAMLAGTNAGAVDDGLTTAHGYAVFGELKYGPDFEHFDYADPDAKKGGTFRAAQAMTFDSLNQVSILGTAPMLLTFNADTLLEQSRDEPASFYCLVCETLTYPEDMSWVEFKLRPEARFADGEPITVEDILYTLGLGDGLATPAYTRVPEMIEKAEKLGPRRLKITFKMANNRVLPSVIGQMPIIPKHWMEQRDPFQPYLDIPPGNGPYQVKEAFSGRYVLMERVKDYWAKDLPVNRGRYNFDSIRHDFYRDASLMDEAFAAGLSDVRLDMSRKNLLQVDGLQAFQSGEIKREIIPYDDAALQNSIQFNVRRAILQDRRVREALLLAYDYEWVKRVILGGNFGRVPSAFSNMPFEIRGLPSEGELEILNKYRDDLPEEVFTEMPSLPIGGSRERARANLLKARGLLREAGYFVEDGKLIDPATGQPVVLKLVAYSATLMPQAAPFIDSAARLGIEVKFRHVDSAQLRLLTRHYDYDMLMTRAVFRTLPAPGAGLRQIWTSEAADTPNLYNYSGISMPVIDEAIDRMVNATDRRTVVDMLHVVDRVSRWEYFNIPLNHNYPTPVGEYLVSYWDKFGRPAEEARYNFGPYMMDNWWFEPEKAAGLSHGVYH